MRLIPLKRSLERNNYEQNEAVDWGILTLTQPPIFGFCQKSFDR
jgi:hypothetical protein